MITKRVQERLTGEEDNQWILGNLTITLKMGNQSVLTVTSMATWQRSAEQKRKNKRQELVLDVTRRGT